MHRKNVHGEEIPPGRAGPRADRRRGRAQQPAAPRIEADVEAIRELQDRLWQLRTELAAPFYEELGELLGLLRVAADRGETDSQAVREALQQVLLIVGTGALATLSGTTRRRLAELTGISLDNTVRRSPLRGGFPRVDGEGRERRVSMSSSGWRASRTRTVVVLGKRGVGKSSTLNYLFGFDRPTDAAVECTVAPYARRIRSQTGQRYRIVDMPGIAANSDSLARYGSHYQRWLARADTVVWITQANVRAYKQDQLFLRDYSAFVRPTARLVLAISKADTQAEGLNSGSAAHHDILRRKAEDIVAELVPYTWARRESVAVVPYSTVEDWNTELLRSTVLAT